MFRYRSLHFTSTRLGLGPFGTGPAAVVRGAGGGARAPRPAFPFCASPSCESHGRPPRRSSRNHWTRYARPPHSRIVHGILHVYVHYGNARSGNECRVIVIISIAADKSCGHSGSFCVRNATCARPNGAIRSEVNTDIKLTGADSGTWERPRNENSVWRRVVLGSSIQTRFRAPDRFVRLSRFHKSDGTETVLFRRDTRSSAYVTRLIVTSSRVVCTRGQFERTIQTVHCTPEKPKAEMYCTENR